MVLLYSNQSRAHLESKLVKGLRQAGVSCDLVDKLATRNIFKYDAASVLAQSERQESSLQNLLSICLDADPLPIHAKGLGEDLTLCCLFTVWASLFWHPANHPPNTISNRHEFACMPPCETLALFWKKQCSATAKMTAIPAFMVDYFARLAGIASYEVMCTSMPSADLAVPVFFSSEPRSRSRSRSSAEACTTLMLKSQSTYSITSFAAGQYGVSPAF